MPETKRLSVVLPKDMSDRLDALARAQRISKMKLIESVLKSYLDRKGKK